MKRIILTCDEKCMFKKDFAFAVGTRGYAVLYDASMLEVRSVEDSPPLEKLFTPDYIKQLESRGIEVQILE